MHPMSVQLEEVGIILRKVDSTVVGIVVKEKKRRHLRIVRSQHHVMASSRLRRLCRLATCGGHWFECLMIDM